MGTLKSTIKIESTDLFPAPVNFTKIKNNSIVVGSSGFTSVALASGLNNLATIPAGNAFLYAAAPATNTGNIYLSAQGSAPIGAVISLTAASIVQTIGTYGAYSPNAPYGFTITSAPGNAAGLYEASTPGPIAALQPLSIVSGGAALDGVYPVTFTTVSGTGAGATGYAQVLSGVVVKAWVDQLAGTGNGYVVGNTLSFPANSLNASLQTFTHVSTGTTATDGVYTNVITTVGSGSGLGATFDVTVSGGVVTTVTRSNGGTNYAVSNVLTISGVNIGGAAGADNVTITVSTIGTATTINVAKVNFGSSITVAPGAITGGSGTGLGLIATIGTNPSTGAQHQLLSLAPDLANIGDGYIFGNTLTITGASLGGVTPTHNVTATVNANGLGQKITVAPGNITTSGAGTGVGLIVYIGVDPATGTPNSITGIDVNPAAMGVGYLVGDTLTIAASALFNGSTTDATITISQVTVVPQPFGSIAPGDVGFFPIGDGIGYTLRANPTVVGDIIQYYAGTR